MVSSTTEHLLRWTVLGVFPPWKTGGAIVESFPAPSIPIMKKHKKTPWAPPAPRVHESKDDRSRTNAGKTVNSKVRSEGRTLAALERAALAKRAFEAGRAGTRAPGR